MKVLVLQKVVPKEVTYPDDRYISRQDAVNMMNWIHSSVYINLCMASDRFSTLLAFVINKIRQEKTV